MAKLVIAGTALWREHSPRTNVARDDRVQRNTWVEFVVGSRPYSEKIFNAYSRWFLLCSCTIQVSLKWGFTVSTFGEGAEGIVGLNMTMAVALLPSARGVARTALSSCKVFCLDLFLS